MNISEDSLRYISELFNGDKESLFIYKSGSRIFHFFNKYFGYNDVYRFGNSYSSRWNITYNKLVELWNGNKFNKFLSIIFSIQYLNTEYPEKTNDELEDLSSKAIAAVNKVFEFDGNKIVRFSDCIKLMEINNDEKLLGEGGYACCYYIISKQLVEKRLKEENYLDKGVVHRFKREFELTKSLSDLTGVIKVFSYNEKKLSYTMEHGECDLYSYVKNNFLDDKSKRTIIYQIVYIMKSVHERNVIHRDLSPTNIFIIGGQLKIADFGLGKDLNAFYSHQTMKTNSVGQYYYCDPRQFMKLKDGDKLSDIYSIGKIINFVMKSNPNDASHKYYSVVEKATCDEKFRYKSIDCLIEGIRNIDTIEADNQFEINFLNKINNNRELNETEITFICSFDERKMFEMIKNMNFRETFVRLREKELIDENMFLTKLQLLNEYYSSNRLSWSDYDDIGYLGSRILLGECSYVSKEQAVNFINIPIRANRFQFMEMVKREILGKIDPTLEEKIDRNINY